jgi:hypothetical protein
MQLSLYNPEFPMDTPSPAPTPTRRDLLVAFALLGTGTAGLAGINLAARKLHEVSAHELAKDPAKYDGQMVQTQCTLHPQGEGELVYQSGGVSLTGLFDSEPLNRQCRVFSVKGLQSESFVVAVAAEESAPTVGQSLQIEGIVSEALYNGKKVFVLTPRVVTLAPLSGPFVPF